MINRSPHRCFDVIILRTGVLLSDALPEPTLASHCFRQISTATPARSFPSASCWARFVASAIAVLAATPSLANDYVLTPMEFHGGPSGIRLVISQPAGWRCWGKKDSSIAAFIPEETPTAVPYTTPNLVAELVVTSEMISDLKVSGKELENPRNASLVNWMSSGTDIERIKTLKAFDAGKYGKLPIWLIEGTDCSYHLVIIVRDGVRVEVGLRSENQALTGGKGKPEAASRRILEELKKHDPALKELVRSIRIVRPK
jgi:hypothetical protein